MTARQRILKLIYPLLLLAGRDKAKAKKTDRKITPPVSFFSLSATLNNGDDFSFENLKGKKFLLVNTASNCGYTAQYAELQKLYQREKERLEIIAFPANDFKEQEKGSDEEIASFCTVNYGVSFPLVKKSTVIKTATQHPVFRWLTTKEQNGWNNEAPSWNFAKYLVNEEGVLTHCFEPAVSPLSSKVIEAVRA